MTDHLTDVLLSALADGELSPDQSTSANQHLAQCAECTSKALHLCLLKSATTKAGQRYAPQAQWQDRLMRLVSDADSPATVLRAAPASRSHFHWSFASTGWAAAALLLVATASILFVQRATQRAAIATEVNVALVTEALDQHVAALASNQPLQVLSTDRHTVKPWFQGKIPFTFNLPQNLPSDTTLMGANLTYLHNQPTGQLLYSIGKHRVSVFLRQRSSNEQANEALAERSGFHVMRFSYHDLEAIAVSDVDPVRLKELVQAIKDVQGS